MHALLVGIGSFGQGWYEQLCAHPAIKRVSVVDTRPEMRKKVKAEHGPFYTHLESALDAERYDFVVNLTPPHVHTAVNRLAFAAGLPVLCEKPIAQDYQEAQEAVALAEERGLLFMIAENYRRFAWVRSLKSALNAGTIGQVSAIHVQFFKEAYYDKPYLIAMPHPTLQDVSIHHFDMFRYLTEAEAKQVTARCTNPAGSRYPGNANVWAHFEMANGVEISYIGSLQAKAQETTWTGDWRIEGEHGVLLMKNDRLRLFNRPGGHKQNLVDAHTQSPGCLDDFLTALASSTAPETSARDYLRSQALVHYASESSRLNQTLEIP